MKSKKTYGEYEKWFNNYVSEYLLKEEEGSVPYKYMALKVNHTFKVVDIIEKIAKSINLSNEEIEIAKIIALFHDTGRFPQIHKYKIDNDSTTENHALLGINELREKKTLQDEDEEIRTLIMKAIMYHNIKDIPDDETDENVILFSKLIRDADKVDIYRVMTEDVNEGMNSDEKEKLYADFDMTPKTSDYVYQTVMSGKSIDRRLIKTLVDHLIMQICWAANDINFDESKRMIRDNHYIEILFNSQQTDDRAKEIYDMVMKGLGEV